VAVVVLSLRCEAPDFRRRESGMHTSMDRLRSRAPKGERAYGKVPKNRGKNTTLNSLHEPIGDVGETMCIKGATDAQAFEGFTSSIFLLPL
jgi:hypothetical protein